MRIGACVHVTGDVEKDMLEIKELGYDTVDVQLANIKEPWYHDQAEMERIAEEQADAQDVLELPVL